MKKLLFAIALITFSCKTNYHCNTDTSVIQLKEACGISVPINNTVYYVNTGNPITVYRVWDETKPWTMLGMWWSLQRPSGSKEEYRKANAICPEWSPLTGIVSAEIKHGAKFFVGTTKGVQCEDVQYNDTSIIQIFIPEPSKSLRNVSAGTWN